MTKTTDDQKNNPVIQALDRVITFNTQKFKRLIAQKQRNSSIRKNVITTFDEYYIFLFDILNFN